MRSWDGLAGAARRRGGGMRGPSAPSVHGRGGGTGTGIGPQKPAAASRPVLPRSASPGVREEGGRTKKGTILFGLARAMPPRWRKPARCGKLCALWRAATATTAGNSLFSRKAFDTDYESVHNLKFSAGGVPEWLKGADCKSVGLAPTLVRIQPPPPETHTRIQAQLAWISNVRPRDLQRLRQEGRMFPWPWFLRVGYREGERVAAGVAQW